MTTKRSDGQPLLTAALPPGATPAPRPRVHTSVQQSSSLQTLAFAAIVVGILYFAKDVLIPVALAVLLSFVLLPLATLLQRYVGRIPSVAIAVTVAFGVIASAGLITGRQLTTLAENLPQYQTNLITKVRDLRGSTDRASFVGQATSILQNLSKELDGAPVEANGTASSNARASLRSPSPGVVQVEIREHQPTPFQLIKSAVAPLLSPLATAGIVLVFVVFFLLQRDDIRARFIRLVGANELHVTTQALDDAARRLGRYLFAQSIINALFGFLIGAGLWAIGLPNPVLWGLLAGILRFIPYIGALIALLAPAILALAVDPGWSTVLWSVGVFLAVEIVVAQGLEPVIYGRSTGLSPVAVVISATFWAWLWGPVGLLLAMPLTLCLVVLGRYAERFSFLAILLGDQPALSPIESFYHRLVAGTADEAVLEAEVHLKANALGKGNPASKREGINDYYETVAIKSLIMAQNDASRGVLDQSRTERIRDTIADVVEELGDHERAPASGVEMTVLCVAGQGPLDEAAAILLADTLHADSAHTRLVSNDAVTPSNLHTLSVQNVGVILLSHLDTNRLPNTRFITRRLRRKFPGVRIVAGFWSLEPAEDQTLEDRLREAKEGSGADAIALSLHDARAAISQILIEEAELVALTARAGGMAHARI